MESSLPALLSVTADRTPAAPAILHGAGGFVTYAELAADTERLAAHLVGLELGGRRVGLLLPNSPAFPLAFYGALRAGCRVLLLNPLNSPRETEEFLQDASVDTVLTGIALLGLLPRGVRALLTDALPGALQLQSETEDRLLYLSAAPPPPPMPDGRDAEAVVIFTAAFDGRARGAVLSHRNLIANLQSTVEAMRLTPQDRVVATLPLIHAFGLTVSLNAPISIGAAVLPVERFNPLRMLDLLEGKHPTLLAGVPAMYIGLLSAGERRGIPRHSLRVSLCGGAPLDVEVQRRWETEFGLPLRQGYGLTEAGPVCLFNRVDRPNRPGTLGYPFPGVEVSIRAEDGAPLVQGEVGEICVRGANVFRGYLGESAPDADSRHGEWLRTGDLGSEEEDGTYRFRGVLKPVFTRNGFNVYPRELERVLRAEPRIAAATVCALPDPVRENEIVLFIRPAPDAVLGEEEVRDYCRSHLAAYKQPTRIVIMPPPALRASG